MNSGAARAMMGVSNLGTANPDSSKEVCDARIGVVAAVPIQAPTVALASYSPAPSSPSQVATALVAPAALAQVSANG